MGDFKSDVVKNIINIFAGALVAGAFSVLGYIAVKQNMLAVSIAELVVKNDGVFAKQENQIKLIDYLAGDVAELKAYKKEHDRYSIEAMKRVLSEIGHVGNKSETRFEEAMDHINEIKRYCYKMEK